MCFCEYHAILLDVRSRLQGGKHLAYCHPVTARARTQASHPSQVGRPAGGGGPAARRPPGRPWLLSCQHGHEQQTRQTGRHAQCSAWPAKPADKAGGQQLVHSLLHSGWKRRHVRTPSLSTCPMCSIRLRPEDSPYVWAAIAPFHR